MDILGFRCESFLPTHLFPRSLHLLSALLIVTERCQFYRAAPGRRVVHLDGNGFGSICLFLMHTQCALLYYCLFHSGPLLLGIFRCKISLRIFRYTSNSFTAFSWSFRIYPFPGLSNPVFAICILAFSISMFLCPFLFSLLWCV